MSRQFAADDFALPLRELEVREIRHFVAGGQAVNIWAEVYSGEAPELIALAPFTSKDCDIYAGPELLKGIEKILDGELLLSKSPADGQLGIFILNDGAERIIDLMAGVYGLDLQELERAWNRSLVVKGIRLLDPLFLLKGKCHNYVQLDQTGRNDERHLRILIEVIPHHLSRAVKLGQQMSDLERDVIREIKFLRRFWKDKWVRKAFDTLEIDFNSLFPVALLQNCGMSRLERFAREAFPGQDSI